MASSKSYPELESQRQPLIRSAAVSSRISDSSSSEYYGTIPSSPRGSIRNAKSRSVEQDTSPEEAVVGRNLGWTSAVMLMFSRMIGSGVFATPGAILIAAGSPGMSLVLWLAGALISFCAMAVYLEFGTMLPRSGGTKVYLEYTFRRPRFLASTVFAMHSILSFTSSNCIVFAEYSFYTIGHEPTIRQSRALAVGTIVFVTFVHGFSLKTGIWIQNAIGFFKMFLMVFMVLSGACVLIKGSTSTPGNLELDLPNLFKGTESNWGMLATGLFKVLYSFSGYTNANNVMNELRDPVRTLKSAAPTALFIVSGTYLIINVAYFAVVPVEEIRNSGQLIAALFFTRAFADSVGRRVLPGLVAISALGSVFVGAYSEARINQEIARQGFIPYGSILASNKPFGAPLGGLLIHLIPSILVITLPPPGDIYAFILNVVIYPSQIFSLAVAIGLLTLRRKRPELERPFKAWKIAVYINIFVAVALLAAPFVNGKKDKDGNASFWYGTYMYAVVGAGILVISIIYWYIWTIALPWYNGYSLEEEYDTLDDGTTITRLVKIHKY